MFSLESPHQGASDEYTHNILFQYKKENYPKSAAMRFFSNGDPRTSRNEPSVFEPPKVYCTNSSVI